MLIGVPKEIKNNEFRVSISPSGVRELVHHGHQVIVQKDAGSAIGFDDATYQEVGALMVDSAVEVFERAEMIVKVKEPQLEECSMIRNGQIIFSYLHLAAVPQIANALIESNCIAIAYETVTSDTYRLPLLAPMSEVAGRVAVQAGAYSLHRENDGRGVLLGGVPGVKAGKVVIIGGGVVGTNAAIIASGMGAEVVILDRSVDRIHQLDERFGLQSNVRAIYSTIESLEENIIDADLVIAAVLVPGAAAPRVINEELLDKMKRGSVIVDVAIDQGGCSVASRPTTHDEPTFVAHGVVHYCVTNMPSAVARTATSALENSTLPYILNLADFGYRTALGDDKHFLSGLNIYRGRVTHEAVANHLSHAYVPPTSFIGK